MADVQSDPANRAAWDVVEEFRRRHVIPTAIVWRRWVPVARENGGTLPVPRIKRETRIIEKIARSGTGLERLQDIGGVRIVVPDLGRQAQVSAALLDEFEVADIDDYVSPAGRSPVESQSRGPKGSGYRAIHVVHRVSDVLIETQIRTTRQHAWAMAAEKAEQITGYALKFGDAPAELLDYFRVAADIEALKDSGSAVDADHSRQLIEYRERIRVYYRSTGDRQ